VPDFGLARRSRRGPSGPAALLRVRPPLTRRVRSARSAAHRAQAPLLGAVGRAPDRILYAEHVEGDGAEIYQRACVMGLGRIVANSRTRPMAQGGRKAGSRSNAANAMPIRSWPSSSSRRA
jgi:hypothetical protein